VNASIDVFGMTSFSLRDAVTNAVDPVTLMPIAIPAKITIARSNGSIVYGTETLSLESISFDACRFRTETLIITIENDGGKCWSNLTFKQPSPPVIESRRSTIFCYEDAFHAPDLMDPPLVYAACQAPFAATYVTDWLIPFECDPGVQDTVKMVLREWEAYDKEGHRAFSFDTIMVLQFPEIDADHIYCGDRDSIYCGDTTEIVGPYITYEGIDASCDTLHVVTTSDVNNDGILEFRPIQLESKCGLDVFVEQVNHKGECGRIYKVNVLIKQKCYGSVDVGCVVTPPAGVGTNTAEEISPGYWQCEFWVYDLDTIAPDIVCKGDPIFSGPFEIENWMTSANPFGEISTGRFFDPEHIIDTSGLPYELKVESVYSSLILDKAERSKNGGEFYQDFTLSYTSDQKQFFDFGWTFDLSQLTEIQIINPNRGIGSYAEIDFTFSINGVEFQIIEEGDEDFLTTKSGSFDPILLTAGRNGILSIPLEPGDLLEIYAEWYSLGRSSLSLYGPKIVSTSDHECSAHTYIPALYARDAWSGVKQVKATVETVGSFILNYDAKDSCWVSHERVKLPKNGENFKVVYEAFDSCHNVSMDSCFIYIKDRVKPVPVMDKGVTVSLSDKKVWMGSEVFDEGSWDNCNVNFVLVRRADWKSACVDFCNEIEACYVNEHNDTIYQVVLERNKSIDEVEAHYAKTLDWFCEDGQSCGELLYSAWLYQLMKYATMECRDHPYDFDEMAFNKLFQEAYFGDQEFREKFTSCDTLGDANRTVEERFSPFDLEIGNATDLFEQLGGGWSESVAFDCEDACSSVTVEMLVMDYWCNWSVVWDHVWVEDKTPVKVVREVSEYESITCKSYREKNHTVGQELHASSIEDIVVRAQVGEEVAFEALDQIFGGYQKAWKDSYGGYVDENGEKIPLHLTFYDSICQCTTSTEKVYVYDEHLGNYWKDSISTNCFYYQDTTILQQGIIEANCAKNVNCEQEIWADLDHCGQGYLYRQFKIWQSCADSTYIGQNVPDSVRHKVDTIIRKQRIYVGNECELNKYMFEIPADTTISTCGIVYDDAGNASGEASPKYTGQVKYNFDDDCRLVGIGYEDKVFKIVGGNEACYKISRTWYFGDWCGFAAEPLKGNWWDYKELVIDSCIQTILVIDEEPPICVITGPVLSGDTIEMGSCDYVLQVDVAVSDICGLTDYHWTLIEILPDERTALIDKSEGKIEKGADRFRIHSQGLSVGRYLLRVQIRDECNNESYCEYDFSIKSVKKPTPVCVTSLTTRLTPWDRDQDGKVDTAHSIIWASEFNRSSVPACGDDSLAFQIELIDGVGDESSADDDDFIELGCSDVGTRLVRLWAISYPSNTVDYCDIVLVVQSDGTGCEFGGTGARLAITDSTMQSHDDHHAREGDVLDDEEYQGPIFAIGRIENEGYLLKQNIPNPFSSETVIQFVLPRAMEATLTIFDASGRIVKNVRQPYEKGTHSVVLDKMDMPQTGVLFYRLTAGQYSAVKRMLLVE